MPRFNGLKTNWVSGEVSLIGRSDLKQYADGAERMRNVVVLPQGGFKTRGGTEKVLAVPEVSAGVRSDTRLVKFQFSSEQVYLFVFSHLKLTILKDDEQVAELTTPYTSDDLRPKFDAGGNITHTGISWAQDLDTMLVFHEDFPIKKIVREGSHTDWAIADFEYVNLPRFEFDDGVYGTKLAATGSFPNGGGSNLSNMTDGNEATLASCTRTPGTGDIASRRIFQIDLGAVVEVGSVEAVGVKFSSGNDPDNELAYSKDGTNWFLLGDEFPISTDANTIVRSREFTARYIALCGQGGTSRTYQIAEFNAYGWDAGVDEIQTIRFPAGWTEGDSLSLLLFDYETISFKYDDGAATMAGRIEGALRELEVFKDGDIEVTYRNENGQVSVTNTDNAYFQVKFVNNAGRRPWEALFVNVISSILLAKYSVTVDTVGRRPGEPVWSDARGYPRCGLFYGGRLWAAGSKALPHYVWATRSLTIDDFNTDRPDDDFGIAEPADAGTVPIILRMFAGRHLQLFSTSGEFYIPASESEAVTPNNIVLRKSTSRGAHPGLNVFDVDGGTFFIQRNAKMLREFLFTDGELAYNATNISLLSPDLLRTPVAIDLFKSSSRDDADYVYLVNEDGTLALLCTLRAENVNGFTLWETQGEFHDVCTLIDDVYFAAVRSVGDVPTMFIEKLNENLVTDCAIFGTVETDTASVALDYLGTETVQPIIDGFVYAEVAVASDVVAFADDATASYEVGLKWPEVLPDDYPGLIWSVVGLPIEVSLPTGAMMGKRRRIVDLTVRLKNTTALTINDNEIDFSEMGDGLLDAPVPIFSGLKKIKGMLGFDREGAIVLGSDLPSKATVLALSYGVSV